MDDLHRAEVDAIVIGILTIPTLQPLDGEIENSYPASEPKAFSPR
jgi:hypothetical protein